MSSFYTSNLMNGYDSSLIPPEKDLQKEEHIEKNEANEATENPKIPLSKVQYPYKAIIDASQRIIVGSAFIFMVYWLYKLPSSEGRLDSRGNIIPSKFLDPCNATNILSLDEIEKIKEKMDAINDEKHSINVVAGYNMSSSSANEYLSHKLASLTEALNTLNKQLKEQKEIRYICYKQNLEKLCEDRSYREQYKLFATGIHVYIVCNTILLLNSFFYILKAKRCDLSPEQRKACNQATSLSLLIIGNHILFVLYLAVIPYLFPCSIEDDLGKFPM